MWNALIDDNEFFSPDHMAMGSALTGRSAEGRLKTKILKGCIWKVYISKQWKNMALAVLPCHFGRDRDVATLVTHVEEGREVS